MLFFLIFINRNKHSHIMSEEIIGTGLLFTSLSCPNCPPAKKDFEQFKEERKDMELHSLGTNTPIGHKLAKKFGIMAVPTFIFYGPGHEKPMGLTGLQTLETLHKYADISLGKQNLEPEKKFSFKNLFKK